MRPTAIGGIAAAAVLLISTPALAHVHPEPASVSAGTSSSIDFELGHGCGNSPTVSLLMQADESLKAKGVTDDTWVASVGSKPHTILWTARTPISHETISKFSLTVSPTASGEFRLPVIQQCSSGANEWIEEEVEGQPEPEFPAPVLTVTSDVAASTGEKSDDDGSPAGLIALAAGGVVAVVAAGSFIVRGRRAKQQ